MQHIIDSCKPCKDVLQDFSGFRVVALLPRYKPHYPPPLEWEPPSLPVVAPRPLGAPADALPVLMVAGKPLFTPFPLPLLDDSPADSLLVILTTKKPHIPLSPPPPPPPDPPPTITHPPTHPPCSCIVARQYYETADSLCRCSFRPCRCSHALVCPPLAGRPDLVKHCKSSLQHLSVS